MNNNEKTRATLFVVVGAYLAYTGISLITDVIADKPDNMLLFIVMGVIFVVVGIYVMITKGKAIMNKEFDEPVDDGVDIEIVDDGVDIETVDNEE
ncbi:MAG: hypothetical protein R3Y58_09030 [Eubacteriales bacterium]